MEKKTKTFNLTEKTIEELKDLKDIVGVSMSGVISLAVSEFYKKAKGV